MREELQGVSHKAQEETREGSRTALNGIVWSDGLDPTRKSNAIHLDALGWGISEDATRHRWVHA